jgi:hypothetical protein
LGRLGRGLTLTAALAITTRLFAQPPDRIAAATMTAGDPFPSNEEMREATTELVALVRSLPMRYYGGERWWSMFIAGALVRMTDTVESLVVLMADDLNIDGRTLLRSLYEQVVTFAWIGIDPDRRQFRWLGRGPMGAASPAQRRAELRRVDPDRRGGCAGEEGAW